VLIESPPNLRGIVPVQDRMAFCRGDHRPTIALPRSMSRSTFRSEGKVKKYESWEFLSLCSTEERLPRHLAR